MTRQLLKPLLISVFLFFAGCVTVQSGSANSIAEAPLGVRTDLSIAVPEGDDPATFIPLTVIRGASEGPTVLMVAGTHGYEFAPILAAQKLADEIASADLAGTLIIVRAAHISAFEGRSPYVNPFDRKNLNRAFPGAPNGSQTERIAWALSSEIIPQADFVLDIHSGDGAEWLEPFIGVYGGPLATDYVSAFAFAEALGFANIIRYKMLTQEQVDNRRSLNRQAVAQGLPTILVEIGQNGSREPEHVEAVVSGIKRGLAGMGMLLTVDTDAPKPLRYFEGTSSVPVANSGIWTPADAKGRFVAEGETLGTIRDYQGRVVETVKAPVSGYAIYGLAGPPVRAGESVVTIAKPSTRPDLQPEDRSVKPLPSLVTGRSSHH